MRKTGQDELGTQFSRPHADLQLGANLLAKEVGDGDEGAGLGGALLLRLAAHRLL